MVAMLAADQADLLAASLTLNPERSRAVDYLFPIGTETYAIYIANPDQEAVSNGCAFLVVNPHQSLPFCLKMDWNIYREPFRTDLWWFLVSAVITLAFLVLAINLAYDHIRGEEEEGYDIRGDHLGVRNYSCIGLDFGHFWT